MRATLRSAAFSLMVTAPLAVTVLALTSASAVAQSTTWVLPSKGCPMSHCDPQLTDIVQGIAAPSGDVQVIWNRGEAGVTPPAVTGELCGTFGHGCSTDGDLAACTYRTLSAQSS